MAKRNGQKQKLLLLKDYFLQNTDENHGVTMKDILSFLESNGITAERKSLYDDFDYLRLSGLDILAEKRNYTMYYKVVSRDFELSELKLLVDAVQSSRFLTARKSDGLIKKLEGLCSKYEASELSRQLIVKNRVKQMNESIYYNVDILHSAIRDNVAITFKYYDFNIHKKKVYRHDGKIYTVSPFSLIWDNENYYLVAFDHDYETLRHYRVDKMDTIKETDHARLGAKVYADAKTDHYATKVFSMFGGTAEKLTLRFANHLANVVLDRFGKNIIMSPCEDGLHFTFSADIVVSPQFFGWLCGLGADAEILRPASVKEAYITHLSDILRKA